MNGMADGRGKVDGRGSAPNSIARLCDSSKPSRRAAGRSIKSSKNSDDVQPTVPLVSLGLPTSASDLRIAVPMLEAMLTMSLTALDGFRKPCARSTCRPTRTFIAQRQPVALSRKQSGQRWTCVMLYFSPTATSNLAQRKAPSRRDSGRNDKAAAASAGCSRPILTNTQVKRPTPKPQQRISNAKAAAATLQAASRVTLHPEPRILTSKGAARWSVRYRRRSQSGGHTSTAKELMFCSPTHKPSDQAPLLE
mmetsp:Transcript_44194/g.127864  ORF Transcript_44194/g.127864 Transcript_44194/m.127864 type:complete len:251 (-) Transcript_44194:814-1566(-)